MAILLKKKVDGLSVRALSSPETVTYVSGISGVSGIGTLNGVHTSYQSIMSGPVARLIGTYMETLRSRVTAAVNGEWCRRIVVVMRIREDRIVKERP